MNAGAEALQIASQSHWLVDIVKISGRSVSDLSPIIALSGAIWLYFLQSKKERQEELRRERQKLYVSYLEAIRNADKADKNSTVLGDGFQTYLAVQPFHEALSVIAPDHVVRVSLAYINANIQTDIDYNHLRKTNVPMTDSETKDSSKRSQILRNARTKLITEMRIDVLKGTQISEELTPVEEIEK